MQFSHYRSELQKMIAKRDGYAVISVAALTLCLFLVVTMLWSLGREKIILVPPTIDKSFWVASSNVSSEYLSEMSAFFAYLRLNLSPDNVTQQHNTLLQYTDPSSYNTLKSELAQEAAHLNESHLSSAFFPVKLTVDAPHLTVRITGDLHGHVGSSLLPTQRVTYAMTYRFNGGRLWVKTFDEVIASD